MQLIGHMAFKPRARSKKFHNVMDQTFSRRSTLKYLGWVISAAHVPHTFMVASGPNGLVRTEITPAVRASDWSNKN
jgi:hypothetical protein